MIGNLLIGYSVVKDPSRAQYFDLPEQPRHRLIAIADFHGAAVGRIDHGSQASAPFLTSRREELRLKRDLEPPVAPVTSR